MVIIQQIAKSTGLDISYVSKVVRSANYRYKIYKLPKRSGGFREIAHPSAELKLIQRWVVENVFSHFPIHKSVCSYREGVGIQDLAELHRKNNYLLRIDFENFFPSIKSNDVAVFLKRNSHLLPNSLSKKDIDTIVSIVCRDKCLTIGAPSSPIITNTILYDFDRLYSNKARRKGVVYSRYADDIYFSTNTPGVLEHIYRSFRTDIRNLKSPSLSINEEKTIFTSKKHKRVVTGLVLTSNKKVSIGRKKKRFIRGLIYQYINDQLDDKMLSYLSGYLSYIKAVEPTFLTRLRTKYGKTVISSIMNTETIKRK